MVGSNEKLEALVEQLKAERDEAADLVKWLEDTLGKPITALANAGNKRLAQECRQALKDLDNARDNYARARIELNARTEKSSASFFTKNGNIVEKNQDMPGERVYENVTDVPDSVLPLDKMIALEFRVLSVCQDEAVQAALESGEFACRYEQAKLADVGISACDAPKYMVVAYHFEDMTRWCNEEGKVEYYCEHLEAIMLKTDFEKARNSWLKKQAAPLTHNPFAKCCA